MITILTFLISKYLFLLQIDNVGKSIFAIILFCELFATIGFILIVLKIDN